MPTATAKPRRSRRATSGTAGSRVDRSAASGTGGTGANGAGSRTRLLIEPDTNGPRIRLGLLWFFLILAAVTSGRMWTALLCAVVAALAGSQIVSAWGRTGGRSKRPSTNGSRTKGSRARQPGQPTGVESDRLVAAVAAGALPLLAGYSTGAVGAGLIAVPVVVVIYHAIGGGSLVTATPTLIGALVPAFSTVPIVFTVRLDLWAGLLLVLAVSMYDAGSFLHGAGASSRWEGPTAGIIGVLAVTFTMGVFHPNPLTPVSIAVAGAVLAVTCPLGQAIASKFLPRPDAKARGLRRLDAYLVAAPAFYVCMLVMTR